jgi:hypothetical protein
MMAHHASCIKHQVSAGAAIWGCGSMLNPKRPASERSATDDAT